MAVRARHSKTSAVPDSGDTNLVQPSDWNADHPITSDGPGLVGRTAAGAGPVAEVSAADGRALLGLGTAATSALSTTNAAALGTAAPGSETTVARADHVHPMPTAAQVGAAPAVHTHTASQVTDFNAAARTQVEATVLAGPNVTITPAGTGASRTLTVSATSSSGAAIRLDGLNDHVDIPDAPALKYTGGHMTLETWFYRDSADAGTESNIFSKPVNLDTAWYNYFVRMLPDGRLRVHLAGDIAWSSPNTTAAVTPDTWHHFVLVLEPGRVILYLNGAVILDAAHPIVSWVWPQPDQNQGLAWGALIAGTGWGIPGQVLNGMVGGLRIYTRAISAAEAVNHWRGLHTNDAGLVVRIDANEGAGVIAHNSAGTNHGTLRNGATWVPRTPGGVVAVSTTQTGTAFGDPSTIGGTLSQTAVGATAGNAPAAFTTIWNLGAGANRDGQFAWVYNAAGTPQLWFRSRVENTGAWNPAVSVHHTGNQARVQAGTVTGQLARWNNTAARYEPVTLNTLPDAADDSAAATAGVAVGGLYRTGSILKTRIA